MVWCTNCARDCRTERLLNGYLCCTACGKVVDQDNFSNDPVFVKNAAGQSQMSGNFVKTVQSDYSASRERTLNDAYAEIGHIANAIGVSGGDSIIRPALAFYTIALERNFTRGRRKEQVAAACLYIACSYVLGAVFLQLCKLLSLEEHPIVQKPVDPSLFIHRFAAGKHLLSL
ncbi:Transcription factor IIIB 70 kDa subunit [Vitis vinifera]|uniref:Transcription factor IIIB 70 kDa subunit n=1 Tax=Vitis vinifera TaxID=29760 RepID=A0A438HZJ1_VITVI|nr:Transcription factor IIIB 70 kDa subunit [Vitis vinifera]RVW89875.1 Transcription factor IIIB 70 kDa subunit [Vitis vinifera]